ncbi:MAG TPA: cupin domain-containing protein [Steroidobacteraceae bacterium]|nr:cupin domain-containing protein [Steroidobacteraceae bacterium]
MLAGIGRFNHDHGLRRQMALFHKPTDLTRQTSVTRAITAVIAACVIAMALPSAAQTGLERKVLLKRDLAIPGFEVVLVEVTIAVGGREGKHSHAGTLVGYILAGDLTLEQEGQPTKVFKAGESVFIEPGKVHEGINKGSVPIRALVTFITEKGKPLTTPVL